MLFCKRKIVFQQIYKFQNVIRKVVDLIPCQNINDFFCNQNLNHQPNPVQPPIHQTHPAYPGNYAMNQHQQGLPGRQMDQNGAYHQWDVQLKWAAAPRFQRVEGAAPWHLVRFYRLINFRKKSIHLVLTSGKNC